MRRRTRIKLYGAIWVSGFCLVSMAWAQGSPVDAPVEPRRVSPFDARPGRVTPLETQPNVGSMDMRPIGNEERRIETVDLRYLDAQTAYEAVLPFASQPEAITVVRSTNSLFVCDSESRVNRILMELERLDVQAAGFMMEMIPLKYIDAETVSKALIPLCSSNGAVTPSTRNNAVIVSDFQKNIDMIREKIKAMDVPAGTLQMQTLNLKFLKAENLEPLVQQMLGESGSVSVNSETNSIMICATSERLKQIVEEIKEADRTPEQILVEVVLMDVRLDDATEIGVNWDMLTSDIKDVSYRQNTSLNRILSTASSSDTLGNATAYNSIGALGGDLSVVSDVVRAVIHMIQEKSDVQIIASPRTMVMSGTEGTIRAVEEVPYTEQSNTGAGGELTSTQFKEVGVVLQVKATLTDANQICMDVSVTQNVRTGESESGVPVVDTRSQKNTLLLGDGQMVVMGGLRRSEETTTLTQIPLLSSIPIVGELFKNRSTQTIHSELVVLIRPHIYRGQEVPATVMERIENFDETFELSKKPNLEIKDLIGLVDDQS